MTTEMRKLMETVELGEGDLTPDDIHYLSKVTTGITDDKLVAGRFYYVTFGYKSAQFGNLEIQISIDFGVIGNLYIAVTGDFDGEKIYQDSIRGFSRLNRTSEISPLEKEVFDFINLKGFSLSEENFEFDHDAEHDEGYTEFTAYGARIPEYIIQMHKRIETK